MKKRIIERNEQQYIDIENFKDYELTNCIAFEMAIRNDHILSLYTLFNIAWYANSKFCKYYKFSNEEIYESTKKQLELEEILKSEYYIFAYDTNSLLAQYNFSSLCNSNVALQDNKTNEDYNTPAINYKNERIIYSHSIDNVSILTTTTKINDTLLEKDTTNPFFYTNVNLKENNELLEMVTHSASIQTKRNKLIIPNYISKEVTLNLNLSLPLHEILSYVEHIHKSFNKGNIPITPIEQLNHKLEKASTKMCYKKPRGKEEDIDANKYLKFQYKLANMLYIYDTYKIGMKQKEIQQALSDYNGEATMDTTIINEMHAIAQEYINNLKYKELITGTQEI